ncbi:MAG TPA: 23S rRNA (pseudouridine(1915)-N(3))-methyltransferase RlmH [Candidatus Aminicenantes bacterium]|nr:23S rRNA (pseudouridine(1915)-N(3))-methyltransferase RlmH [Candidatus Aminicenantes bacterium]
MRLKFLWPGRTRSPELRGLQALYETRIGALAACEVIETREARGLEERHAGRIKDLEARGLEKHLEGACVICLDDRGKEMTSDELAAFLRRKSMEAGKPMVFVVGGFLGLADRVLERADMRLALSRLTLSHELARVVLLEQVYRALTVIGGRHYAK